MPQATIVVVGLMVRNFKNLGGVSMYTYLAYKLSNKKNEWFLGTFCCLRVPKILEAKSKVAGSKNIY